MKDISEAQKPWILQGYQVFSYEGPPGLKVERLARTVGKSKSSFYHHFADLEVFIVFLLKYHLTQTHLIAEKEAECKSLHELIDIIVEYKVDLLFNRQLRIHRENPDFEAIFLETNQITAKAIVNIWAKYLELTDNTYLAQLVLKLSMENFYLQITDETLNHDWLNNYFQELRSMIREFKKTGKVPSLDGNV